MEIRRIDRAITDKMEIQEIVKKGKFLHLGLIDGNYPYIIPLHYGFKYCDTNDTFVFYMHGAKTGHKINVIEKASNAFIEIETDVALTSGENNPCMYGSLYSSFMGRGVVSLVDDLQEKKDGLRILMMNQTDRSFEFTEQMASSVAVIKVVVYEYTAKARKYQQTMQA